MTRLLFISAFIFCLSSPIVTFADTVDVWTVKLNGKVIINSNQTAIIYGKSPMKINLSSLKNSDTLQICYWTDSGLEKYKWYFLFKDVNKTLLEKFTNRSDYSNGKADNERENYISFSVQSLRQLIKSRKIKKIFIEFQQDKPAWSSSYLHKPVCIIRNG